MNTIKMITDNEIMECNLRGMEAPHSRRVISHVEIANMIFTLYEEEKFSDMYTVFAYLKRCVSTKIMEGVLNDLSYQNYLTSINVDACPHYRYKWVAMVAPLIKIQACKTDSKSFDDLLSEYVG